MPTRTGIATLIFAIAFLAAGRIFGIFELYVVAAVMLALLACAIGWVTLNWRSLVVERSVNPPRVHAGATSVVTLALSNRRLIPTPVARITDEVAGEPRADAQVPPLSRHRTTKASYRVPAERRGQLPIGPMHTRVTDPFGLASVFRRSAPDASLLVLPRIDVIAPPPQPNGLVATRLDRDAGRMGSHGEEFSSLRSYVVGDDLRKVHWPSTARTGELVVRTEDTPEHGHSLIVLDTRIEAADHDRFERMVSAAASIASACRERGDLLRLLTTGGGDHLATDTRSFDRLMDHLAVVQQNDDGIHLSAGLVGDNVDTAVLVLGTTDDLLTGAAGLNAVSRSTVAVQFGYDSPRSAAPKAAVRSPRMIFVSSDDAFAPKWTESVGASR